MRTIEITVELVLLGAAVLTGYIHDSPAETVVLALVFSVGWALSVRYIRKGEL